MARGGGAAGRRSRLLRQRQHPQRRAAGTPAAGPTLAVALPVSTLQMMELDAKWSGCVSAVVSARGWTMNTAVRRGFACPVRAPMFTMSLFYRSLRCLPSADVYPVVRRLMGSCSCWLSSWKAATHLLPPAALRWPRGLSAPCSPRTAVRSLCRRVARTPCRTIMMRVSIPTGQPSTGQRRTQKRARIFCSCGFSISAAAGGDADNDDSSGTGDGDWQAGAPWTPWASYPDPVGAQSHGVFPFTLTLAASCSAVIGMICG